MPPDAAAAASVEALPPAAATMGKPVPPFSPWVVEGEPPSAPGRGAEAGGWGTQPFSNESFSKPLLAPVPDPLSSTGERCHSAALQHAVGWPLLGLTLFCFALMAPLGRLVIIPPNARFLTSVLLTAWRTTAATALLLPCTLLYVAVCGLDPEQRRALGSWAMWRGFLECGLYQAVGGIGYSAAITYTTIPQAVLFANLHPVLVIVYRYVRTGDVSCGEVVGVAAAMLGLALVVGGQVFRPLEEPRGDHIDARDMLLGDACGLVTSLTFSMVLVHTNALRRRMPVVLFLTLQMGIGTLLTFLVAPLVGPLQLSPHMWCGLFGFVHRRWAAPVGLGSVLMLVGWFGASAVTRYLPPLAVSTCLTLEPAAAVLLGLALGLEALPSAVTASGIGVMLFAAVVVARSAPPVEKDAARVPLTGGGPQPPHPASPLAL
eukprot:EG_transcript_9923